MFSLQLDWFSLMIVIFIEDAFLAKKINHLIV